MLYPLVLTAILVTGLTTVLAIPVLIRLMRQLPDEVSREWLENFSVAPYYPMEQLLNEEDFRFLSRQPGFDPSLYRKLRRDRLKIFKQYLNRAIADFNRLYAAAMAALPYASQDSSDVAMRLLRLRLRFAGSVFRAEFNYRICYLGYRSLAVYSLLSQMEELSVCFLALTENLSSAPASAT